MRMMPEVSLGARLAIDVGLYTASHITENAPRFSVEGVMLRKERKAGGAAGVAVSFERWTSLDRVSAFSREPSIRRRFDPRVRLLYFARWSPGGTSLDCWFPSPQVKTNRKLVLQFAVTHGRRACATLETPSRANRRLLLTARDSLCITSLAMR